MNPIDQITQASHYQAPSTSLIETKLQEARRGGPDFPCSSLIHYADMWFNLKGDARFELRISDAVKWQLYFAATAHREHGLVITGYFSGDHLNPRDLVLLYRILNSYYMDPNYPEKEVFFQHLWLLERRFNNLILENPQNKQEILQYLREHNDRRLQIMIASIASEDPRLAEMKLDLARYVDEPWKVNRALAARRIIECYLTQSPLLDLRGLRLVDALPDDLDALPDDSLQHLTHLRSIYLNGNNLSFRPASIFNQPAIIPGLFRLPHLQEFFRFETEDPNLIEMQADLHRWILDAGDAEQKSRRLNASLGAIIPNYFTRNPQLSLVSEGLTSLPACIRMFTHLDLLSMNSNNCNVFPETIRHLPNLRELGFYASPFSSVPEWVSELRNLRTLDLRDSYITELPAALARLPRTCSINAEHTRLTLPVIQAFQRAIEEARRENPANGPNLTFSIHEAASLAIAGAAAQVQPVFRTLEENISAYLRELQTAFPKDTNPDFWKDRSNDRFPQAGGSNDHLGFYEPLLSHERKDLLMVFLTKLRNVKDYQTDSTKANVLVKVDQMLEGACTNEAFRDQLFICLGDANSSCGDRVTIYFNQIEILWRIYCRGSQMSLEEMKDLVIGRHRIILLEEIAYQKIRKKGLGDHIETILFYQVKLKDILCLPVTTQGMLYGGVAGINEGELEEAIGSVLEVTTNPEDIIKLLLENDSWKNRERMEENPWTARIKALHRDQFAAMTDAAIDQSVELYDQKDTMPDQEYRQRLKAIEDNLKNKTDKLIERLTREFVFRRPAPMPNVAG